MAKDENHATVIKTYLHVIKCQKYCLKSFNFIGKIKDTGKIFQFPFIKTEKLQITNDKKKKTCVINTQNGIKIVCLETSKSSSSFLFRLNSILKFKKI